MTWAWATELPPTPKLVLMALADIADDQGICWPSQNTLARKCSMAERSVRRILLQLQASELLYVESRFRPNGSQASNRYRLAISGPPDNLSGAPRSPEVGPPGHQCPGGVDISVPPRTTIELSIEPPLQPRSATDADNVAVSGGGCDLKFPTPFSASQRATLRAQIAAIPIAQAQSVLDELAGRMTLTKVNNPIRYALVLLERMQAGRFVPELGPRVADMRRAELARVARLAAPEPPLPLETVAEARKLPAKLRASLDRMRSKSQVLSQPNGNGTTRANSNDPADDQQ